MPSPPLRTGSPNPLASHLQNGFARDRSPRFATLTLDGQATKVATSREESKRSPGLPILTEDDSASPQGSVWGTEEREYRYVASNDKADI